MRLAEITCDYVLVPVTIPVRETHQTKGIVLVTVVTDDGLRGVGLARSFGAFGRGVRAVVENDVAPYLMRLGGGDFVTPGQLWHDWSFDVDRGPTGIMASAMSAVDQALWDIWGQALGEPVYRLLGGAQAEIEIYVTFGLNIFNPDEEREAAQRCQAAGFTAFKLQGVDDSGRDIETAAARVRQLRETVGDDARIILDAHNNYNLYDAMRLARAIEPYNVAFIDEPLFAGDPGAMRRLREACPRVPIAGRSRAGGLLENRDLVAEGGVDVLGSSVLDQGGFTQSIKNAHHAEMYQLPVVTGGGWHLQNAHLIAAATNGWMTEYHMVAAQVSDQLFIDPIQPTTGWLRLGDKPGLGLELNEPAVAEAIDRGRHAEQARTS